MPKLAEIYYSPTGSSKKDHMIIIRWDDSEGYTCGWLLSVFVRMTENESHSDYSTVAIRSKDGKYITLDFYLTQTYNSL